MIKFCARFIKQGKVIRHEEITIEEYEMVSATHRVRQNPEYMNYTEDQIALLVADKKTESMVAEYGADWVDLGRITE